MSPTKAASAIAVPASPREHAHRITEAVVNAWHSNYGGSRVDIPISVVAALSLLPERHPGGPELAPLLLRLDGDGFIALLRRLELEFGIMRPDLRPRTKPLWSWLEDDALDPQLVRAVHATGRAALAKGQLALTGVAWRANECDLLGTVLQAIRSRKDREARGQFLTPLPVTELIGMISLAELAADRPNDEPLRVLDPCVGTGAMLLGAANALREHGHDPAAVEWWANDIDWVAAACCAVNMHLWDLGLRVVIGCGDGLFDTWMHDALTERQAAIDELNTLWKRAKMFAGMRWVLGLDPPEDPFLAHLRRLQPPPPKAAPPHSSTFDAEAAYRQAPLF